MRIVLVTVLFLGVLQSSNRIVHADEDYLDFPGNATCPATHPVKTGVNNFTRCLTLASFCATNPQYYDTQTNIYCPDYRNNDFWIRSQTSSTTTTQVPAATTTIPAPISGVDYLDFPGHATCPASHPVKTGVNNFTRCLTLASFCATNPQYYDTQTNIYCPDYRNNDFWIRSQSITSNPTFTTVTTVTTVTTLTTETILTGPTPTVGSELEGLSVGKSIVKVDGQEVLSTQVIENNSVVVVAGDVRARLDGASPDNIDPAKQEVLVLISGEDVTMNLGGLMSASEVTITIYSEPRLLAVLKTDEEGLLATEIKIPADLVPGNHVLVLSGIDLTGNPISLSFGLLIVSSVVNSIPLLFVVLLVVFGVGLIATSLKLWSIRQSKTSIV